MCTICTHSRYIHNLNYTGKKSKNILLLELLSACIENGSNPALIVLKTSAQKIDTSLVGVDDDRVGLCCLEDGELSKESMQND